MSGRAWRGQLGLALVAVGLVWGLPIQAEPPLAQRAPQAPLVFSTGVQRVRLDALVHDKGRPITGLTAADFIVTDNGRPVRDLEVTQAEERITVTVALDISGSIAEEFLDEMRDAVMGVIDALEPADRGWLLVFNNQLELRAGPVADRARLRQALEGLQAGRGTSMWDALFASVALAGTPGERGRSLALVFSDGADSTSWLDDRRALDVVRRSDVVFSIIRPRHAAGPYGNVSVFSPLERAAVASGGVILKTERGKQLDSQFVNLLREFRQGYVLSFSTPAGSTRDDGWHEVDVRLKSRKGEVRVRPGYFAPGR